MCDICSKTVCWDFHSVKANIGHGTFCSFSCLGEGMKYLAHSDSDYFNQLQATNYTYFGTNENSDSVYLTSRLDNKTFIDVDKVVPFKRTVLEEASMPIENVPKYRVKRASDEKKSKKNRKKKKNKKK